MTKPQDIVELRRVYNSLSHEQKKLFLSSLSQEAFNEFRFYSDVVLRPDQAIPEDGVWRYCIAQAGRGWGKSMLGAHFIAQKVHQKQHGLAIAVPTYGDIEDYIIQALTNEFPANQKPKFIGGTKNHFQCYNGIIVKCYSSDKEIRGSNLSYLWIDEFCAWCDRNEEKATERFRVLDKAIRKGAAKIIITTTPRPWKILIDFEDRFLSGDKKVHIIRGETSNNTFLSHDAVIELYRSSSGRDARQELKGEILRDNPGAYWTIDEIDNLRAPTPKGTPPNKVNITNDMLMGRQAVPESSREPYLIRTVLGFDPAVSKGGDECGIIIASLFSNGKAYVIADFSGSYNPGAWSELIARLYIDYNIAAIVVEKNNGGNTFSYIMRSVNATMNIIEIHTKEGKTTRAEHISALYHQGRVYHTQVFHDLESQMCAFNINCKSPDRLDALGYALSELFWPTSNKSNIQVNPPTFKNLPGINR